MMSEDERDFEFRDSADDADSDPDTNLILDYLSNKLAPDDVVALEERAKKDKDFRYKLADIVLLKGLVMLALEKNPGPEARACRRTQRLFLDYLKGKTSVANTAQLSKHLEECFECELAFERFQEHKGEVETRARGGWGGFLKAAIAPRRHLAIAGLVVAALAAGAFGIVGFLTSAGSGAGAARLEGPGGSSESLTRPEQLREAVDRLVAADPTLDQSGELSAIMGEILDYRLTASQRAERYETLGKSFGSRVERLLWALAENEPNKDGREAAYRAIDGKNVVDFDALVAATRREMLARSGLAMNLTSAMLSSWNATYAAFIRSLFSDDDTDDVEKAQILRSVYRRLKDDDVVQARMTACLKSPSDRVRSICVQGAAEAERTDVMPLAFDLLKSPDSVARSKATLTITRHGTRDEFETMLADPGCSKDRDVWSIIIARAHKEGLALHQLNQNP